MLSVLSWVWDKDTIPSRDSGGRVSYVSLVIAFLATNMVFVASERGLNFFFVPRLWRTKSIVLNFFTELKIYHLLCFIYNRLLRQMSPQTGGKFTVIMKLRLQSWKVWWWFLFPSSLRLTLSWVCWKKRFKVISWAGLFKAGLR